MNIAGLSWDLVYFLSCNYMLMSYTMLRLSQTVPYIVGSPWLRDINPRLEK